MRASQNIDLGRNTKLTPAQLRLTAGANGPTGMRFLARRSALPRARRAEVAAALTGAVLIVSLILGLMAI
jgi:hypothetical protein